MAEAPQHWYAKMNDEIAQMAGWLKSPFLLFIRLYWGWQLAVTGWAHLHNLDTFTQFFTSLGIPVPVFNAYMCANLEFFGGLLLIAGLANRYISLLIICDMFVAYYTADRDALKSIISDPDKFTGAAPYNFLYAALILFIFGAGAISVDHLMRHHFEKKRLQRQAKLDAAS
jgi:putative oxidoreductase